MSYGWLTQSSLLPGKKKQIDVESKTVTILNNQFIDLKVNLLKEKEKLMTTSESSIKVKDIKDNYTAVK
jgi:hypothetical protein